jgi:hypothetical protein
MALSAHTQELCTKMLDILFITWLFPHIEEDVRQINTLARLHTLKD